MNQIIVENDTFNCYCIREENKYTLTVDLKATCHLTDHCRCFSKTDFKKEEEKLGTYSNTKNTCQPPQHKRK